MGIIQLHFRVLPAGCHFVTGREWNVRNNGEMKSNQCQEHPGCQSLFLKRGGHCTSAAEGRYFKRDKPLGNLRSCWALTFFLIELQLNQSHCDYMHWHLKRWQSPGISWNNKDFPKPVGNIFRRSMRRIKLHTLSLCSTLKFSTPSNVSRTFSILSWTALSELFG